MWRHLWRGFINSSTYDGSGGGDYDDDLDHGGKNEDHFCMLQAIPRWQEKQEFDRKSISCLWGGAFWARHTSCISNRSGKTEIEIWQKNLRFLLQVGAAVRACERDQGDNCSQLPLPLKTLTPPFLRLLLRLFLGFHSTPFNSSKWWAGGWSRSLWWKLEL